ncbi:TPA: hypothetical protein ACGEAP_005719, partial [Klebsiella pneumoniae]
MRGLRNIYNLGVKELRSLLGDKAMLALIVFAFTVSVYVVVKFFWTRRSDG